MSGPPNCARPSARLPGLIAEKPRLPARPVTSLFALPAQKLFSV